MASGLEAGSLSEIAVRFARATDRERVLAFCAHTWDDGDYIADVWDHWLSGTSGSLLVAAESDRPVGVIHARMVADEEGWIEGLRVDPAYRRAGVGRMLVSRALAAAQSLGAQTVRYLTGATNVASQQLFARFAFTRVAELVRYRGGVQESGTSPRDAAPVTRLNESVATAMRAFTYAGALGGGHLRVVTPGEFEHVWEWLMQSNLSPFNGGLEMGNWTARALTEPRLRHYLTAGEVLALEEWETILALAIVRQPARNDDQRPRLSVRYMDGQAEAIGRLALTLRMIAANMDATEVEVWLPDLLILRDAMAGAGYEMDPEGAMWVHVRDF